MPGKAGSPQRYGGTTVLIQAADWAEDRFDDAADAAGDFVGDRVDALRESNLNPGNWF